MIWVIVIIGIIIFISSGISGANKLKENYAKFTELGYSLDTKIDTGKYVGGHPDINDPLPKSSIFPKDNNLEIMLESPTEIPIKKGEIENSSVKNILVEDQSTVEKRVTVGRLLMTGIFAFAWRKEKKNELAYLTIEWNDGRFDHETIFEFEGYGSMQKANTARNNIIKIVR